MTLIQRLITGQADGTAATTGNTGAATVSANTGSTITWRTAVGAHGQTGLQYTAKSASTCLTRFNLNAAASQVQTTFKFTTPTANPSADVSFAHWRHASGRMVSLVWRTTGTLFILDAGNTYTQVFAAGVLAFNTQYVIAVQGTTGASGAGVFVVKVYTTGGSQVGSTTNLTTANLTNAGSVVNFAAFDILGSMPTLTADAVIGVVDLQLNDGAGSEIPDYVPVNSPPTVDAGVNQNVSASATVNLSASASDTDGTIASYAWTYDYPTTGAPALTGGTTATPSFTAGAAGSLYILRCTVTDNVGATADDTVEVRVPVAGATSQRHVATTTTGSGSWSIGGGSASFAAALTDETDTTYVESPTVTGTEATRRVRVTPGAAKATGTLKERLWTDTGTANATVRLVEGSTTRQTWTQAVTTTATEYTFTLSAGTISAISDWGNLFVELGVTS